MSDSTVPPGAPHPAAGPVTEEMVERAQSAWRTARQLRDGQPHRMRAALSAVAPQIRAAARAECAAELREELARSSLNPARAAVLADSWSTPPDGTDSR